MKMKGFVFVVALLAGTISAQGTQIYFRGGIDADYTKVGNWLSNDFATVSAYVPGLADIAEIHSGAILVTPVISSSAPDVGTLHIGSNSPEGSLIVVDGGSINAGTLRVGQAATGTLTMTGGLIEGSLLNVGYNAGTGIVDMSGNSILHYNQVDFSQGASGVVNMEDNARFRVTSISGVAADALIDNGNILATNAGSGKSVEWNWISAGGYVEYTVIPEPATLGLMSLLGGGLLWFRHRFGA